MATARTFLTLYSLVQTICQDQSTNGKAQAQSSINTIIKELTKMFKLPQMFKGYDNSIFITLPNQIGVQTSSLAPDLVRLSNVWWLDTSKTNWQLDEIQDDISWNSQTDEYSQGTPTVFRYFQPSSENPNPQLQTWMGANQSWIAQSGGIMYYSYWAQLAQLVNDSDVPNLPYELDTVLVNGGVVEMSRQQGDTTLMGLYEKKYEDDLGEIRAWLIKLKTKDGQLSPYNPGGIFGIDSGAVGYKIVG